MALLIISKGNLRFPLDFPYHGCPPISMSPDFPDFVVLSINLDWPMQITETEFFRRIKEMPKGKVYGFLSR